MAYLPYVLIAYVWLGAILTSAGWLLLRAIGWGRGGASVAGAKLLGVPALTFAALTGPLWVEAVMEEVDCRIAGLRLDSPIQAGKEGIYWRSHGPGPSHYSGNQLVHDDWRGEIVRSLLRGLVEGRIGYLEIPHAPAEARGSESEITKFYFARTDNSQVECFISSNSRHGNWTFNDVINNLPPGTCIVSSPVK